MRLLWVKLKHNQKDDLRMILSTLPHDVVNLKKLYRTRRMAVSEESGRCRMAGVK
jgi:hypothetical protein